MRHQYCETLSIVIPIAQRDNMATIATHIMSDKDESRLFDFIKLSSNGQYPITHLMTYTPCTHKQASLWCSVFDITSHEFPRVSISDELKRLAQASMQDESFIFCISKRLKDGLLIKTQPISVLIARVSFKSIQSPRDVYERLNLLIAQPIDESEN